MSTNRQAESNTSGVPDTELSPKPLSSPVPGLPHPVHAIRVSSPRKPRDFTRTPICRLRVHCRACRTSAAWRTSVMQAGLSATPDWDCPYGYTAAILPTPAALAMAKELEVWRKQNMPCCNKRKYGQPPRSQTAE